MTKPAKPNPDDVRAAESAAQRSVCNMPDPIPDDLTAALDRRVEANLEAATDATVRRIGSTDPEVRRLEGPHRKRSAPADSSATPRRTKKRPAVQVKPKQTPKEK